MSLLENIGALLTGRAAKPEANDWAVPLHQRFGSRDTLLVVSCSQETGKNFRLRTARCNFEGKKPKVSRYEDDYITPTDGRTDEEHLFERFDQRIKEAGDKVRGVVMVATRTANVERIQQSHETTDFRVPAQEDFIAAVDDGDYRTAFGTNEPITESIGYVVVQHPVRASTLRFTVARSQDTIIEKMARRNGLPIVRASVGVAAILEHLAESHFDTINNSGAIVLLSNSECVIIQTGSVGSDAAGNWNQVASLKLDSFAVNGLKLNEPDFWDAFCQHLSCGSLNETIRLHLVEFAQNTYRDFHFRDSLKRHWAAAAATTKRQHNLLMPSNPDNVNVVPLMADSTEFGDFVAACHY